MNADLLYLVGGAALLVAVVLPALLDRVALSAPIVLVVLGLALGLAPFFDTATVTPKIYGTATEHLAELTVIVALMGVGLALDRPLTFTSWSSWQAWGNTWRLLVVAMPLCIAATALLGWWAIGLAPATALLLGACLAPTDPVLAADVQVAGPTTEEAEHIDEKDEVRFALTSEGGLNDALAFPFVYAAIYLLTRGDPRGWALSWLLDEMLLKVLVGVAVGVAAGWAIAHLAFRGPANSLRFAERGEPLVALAATLLVYGLAEAAHGWGFLAVFAAALTIRARERSHDYHERMHELIERLELLLTLLVLLLLGISLADGLLSYLTWQAAAVGIALLVFVRPGCSWLALGRGGDDRRADGSLGPRERLVTAFFGVRGVGSVYYVAYALGQASFPQQDLLWSTVTFTIVASVLLHGALATPAMRWLESVREKDPRVDLPS